MNTPNLMGLSAPGAAQGGASNDQTLKEVLGAMQQSMEFQGLMTSFQQSHNAFTSLVTAKQEAIKSIADIARDGIRKSADR